MKTFTIVALLSCLTVFGFENPRVEAKVEIDFGTYAAIAYSPATGKYGYAWNHVTRSKAENIALSKCTAADAKIVGWVKGGWLALAIGKDNTYGVGWQYGNGAANTDAKNRALQECAKHGPEGKIVLCVCSGNIAPEIRD